MQTERDLPVVLCRMSDWTSSAIPGVKVTSCHRVAHYALRKAGNAFRQRMWQTLLQLGRAVVSRWHSYLQIMDFSQALDVFAANIITDRCVGNFLSTENTVIVIILRRTFRVEGPNIFCFTYWGWFALNIWLET